MTEQSDTLNIGSIRLRKEYDIARSERLLDTAGEHNPAAAAAARARIEAFHSGKSSLTEYKLGSEHQLAPATPTADLVTDKIALAGHAYHAPLVHGRKLPTVLVPALTAIGVFLLVLLVFKAPVIISQVQYSLSPKPQAAAILPSTSEVIPAQNTITIPKINVQAPVNYEPSIQEAAIQTALQTGVVHYGNTAAPGQPGNVAIFGHSSNDWWEAGNYKFVFVLLDKLSPGDQITVDYSSHRYVYEVTGSKIVDPTDVGVLNPTSTPTLTLITCTPPGTSLKRLVVTAKQITPDPTKTVVAVATPPTTQAPAALTSSPSFLDQLSQAWTGIFSGIPSLFGASPAPSPTPGANSTGQLPAAK